jgi:uncharacterized protein (TIGR01244 family)
MTSVTTWLILAVLAVAQTPQSADTSQIRNFLRVSADFCTGGQPTADQIAKLKADGVRAVLNLRTPAEYRMDDEVQAVTNAGLKYFNIPVVPSAPTDAQADEFLRLTDNPANRPMFIHCASAARVGAFWMIRRVLRDRWTEEAALTEARKVGLTGVPALEEFAKRYIATQQGKPAPAPAAGAPVTGEWTGLVLTGIVAIGGETTGIVLDTGREKLELQCDATQRATIEGLKGQQVMIRGKLETRTGVEVPVRRIIVVTEIIRR